MAEDSRAAHVIQVFKAAAAAHERMAAHAPAIVAAAHAIATALGQGRAVLAFGNGGSAADAQHFAAEMVGRYERERKAWPAIALTTDTSALTAVGNDYGFDRVFARQLEALGRDGDIALGISTSGNSPNVVAAVQVAQSVGVMTIAFTGPEGGRMLSLADLTIPTPAGAIEQVEDMHLAMCHSLCVALRCQLAEEAAGPVLVEEDLTSALWAR